MSVSYGGDSIVFADGSVNASGFIGHRNRIINGAMVIDQRNAGASVTPNNAYTLDRWNGIQTTASKFSVQQNAGSVTPPAGFTKYLGITSLSAYAVTSSDYYQLKQAIEGHNVADLNWGTASANSITVSFWVRSSLSGSFGLSIKWGSSSANQRSYPILYTISATNTWEYKTIIIPGDTTMAAGGFETGASSGIQVQFSLGGGATNAGPSGSWAGTNYQTVVGETSVVGTSGATWYVTGVQLERGSAASSFEYRSYGAELALCQRYCFALISTGENNSTFGGFWRVATGKLVVPISFPVVMRANPTCSIPAGNNSWSVEDGVNPYTGTPTLERPNPYNVMVNIPLGSNPSFSSGYATAAHMFAATGAVCLLASAEL